MHVHCAVHAHELGLCLSEVVVINHQCGMCVEGGEGGYRGQDRSPMCEGVGQLLLPPHMPMGERGGGGVALPQHVT